MARIGNIYQNLVIFHYTLHLIIITSLKRKINRLEEEDKGLKEQIKINYDDIYKQL